MSEKELTLSMSLSANKIIDETNRLSEIAQDIKSLVECFEIDLKESGKIKSVNVTQLTSQLNAGLKHIDDIKDLLFQIGGKNETNS